jgi:hypothetical protein
MRAGSLSGISGSGLTIRFLELKTPFIKESPLILDRAVSIADGGLILGKGHTGDGYYTPYVSKAWIAYPVYKTH